MADIIPDGITQKHILRAIDALNVGAEHDFADSTGYDLLYKGKRYPPKAVVGIAAGLLTGQQLGPYDFKGGISSKCFRTLELNEFEIVTKLDRTERSIKQKRREWSSEELKAAVIAYVDMLHKEARREDFTKTIYYQELAGRFGRTTKSFEFRMQNDTPVFDHDLGIAPSKVLQGRKPRA